MMNGTAASWQNRTAVITGGTGFIGAAIARKLVALGATVIVPTRNGRKLASSSPNNIRYVAARLTDTTQLTALLNGADVLFNLAYDFRRSVAENIALYTAIADSCATARIPMLVQASSIAVYDGWPSEDINENSPCDGPGHEYKIAKRAIERDVIRRVSSGAFDAAILQPTIVYGPGSPQWTDALAERMHNGSVILPEGIRGLCNGVYIDDVVDAFIAAATLKPGGGRRFIVSGPRPFPWADLFAAYADASGASCRYEPAAPYQPTAQSVSGRQSIGSALAKRISAALAERIGTANLARLRSHIMRLRPGASIYRPVGEQPRLFHARGIASIAASTHLHTPCITPEQGLKLTQDYIRAKYPPSAR
jgi:nucleoside-diphosphate-sugar epimerase